MYYTIKYSLIISRIVRLICEIEELCEKINIPDDNTQKKEEEDTLNDKLKLLQTEIYGSGCIGIKFAQWYISKLKIHDNYFNNKIIEYFTDIFDNCPQHSYKYTFELFKKDFGVDIGSILNMKTLKVIASGSIGQVYYGKLKNGKEVAIKVKHPNIDEEVAQFENFVYGLSTIQKIGFIKRKYKLYFNFSEFMEHIKKQIDMELEVFNILKFRNNYNGNKYLVFPKIYYYSRNIIIMEYIHGEKFEDLTQYHKMKTALNILAFIQHSFFIDDFSHQDLHDGNWCVKKIKKDDKQNSTKSGDEYALVVFDCGLCIHSGDVKRNRELWGTFEKNDKNSIYELIRSNITQGEIDKEIEEEIMKIIDTFQSKQCKIGEILHNIIDYLNQNTNILIDNIVLNTIIISGTVEHVLNKHIYLENREPSYYNDENVRKTVDECGGTNTIGTYNMRQNIISFCKSKNIYPKLREYLEGLHKESVKTYNSKIFFRESANKFLDLDPPE